jgi:hypothetical protein
MEIRRFVFFQENFKKDGITYYISLHYIHYNEKTILFKFTLLYYCTQEFTYSSNILLHGMGHRLEPFRPERWLVLANRRQVKGLQKWDQWLRLAPLPRRGKLYMVGRAVRV